MRFIVLLGLVWHWTLCKALCSQLHDSSVMVHWPSPMPACCHFIAPIAATLARVCTLFPLLPGRLQTRMTMARTLKLYKLPDEPLTPGIRALERRDIAQASLPGMRSFPSTVLLSCSAACSS